MSLSAHMLRMAAANQGEAFPSVIGEPWGGGFYFGDMTISGSLYALIVAPKSGEPGNFEWAISNGFGSLNSVEDGFANSESMDSAIYPAARYCRNTYGGGGFEDWYLGAEQEMVKLWTELGPTRPGTPSHFSAEGSEALLANARYWTSTFSGTGARSILMGSGSIFVEQLINSRLVRPIRRILKG